MSKGTLKFSGTLPEKLEQYQELRATVLAEAFMSHESKEIIPKDFPPALRAYADEYEKKNAIRAENWWYACAGCVPATPTMERLYRIITCSLLLLKNIL